MPRPNGYQSLHTSVISEQGVPFEVQIRSEEMHRRAEEGIAAHWKYKEGRIGDQRDERYFQWLRQLLELQQEVRDPQEFMQNLKIDLYPEEVYVFTPKGEVRSLPKRGHAGGLRLRRPHRRRPPVRGGAHQRQDGAAAHAAAERRHRPDQHPARPPAQPRLAVVCRHVAGAQQDQARAAGRGALPQHRVRAAAVRKGSAAVRPEPEDAARERGDGAVRRGVRRARSRGPAGLRGLRQAGAAHDGAEGRAGAVCCASGRRTQRWCRRSSACCAPAARRTRSRSAAPTTSWCSWPAAATRSAASASSATSPGARACRCTRPPAATSST